MSHLACPFASRCDTQCNIPISYPGGNEILPLSSCSKDINAHLRQIFVAQTCASFEKELIPARVGLFDEGGHDFTICPEHRDQLGVKFRASINKSQGKVGEGLNLRMSIEIKRNWNVVVPQCWSTLFLCPLNHSLICFHKL